MAGSILETPSKSEWVSKEFVHYFKTHYKMALFGNKITTILLELRAHNLVVEVSKTKKKNGDGNKGKVHKWLIDKNVSKKIHDLLTKKFEEDRKAHLTQAQAKAKVAPSKAKAKAK